MEATASMYEQKLESWITVVQFIFQYDQKKKL
jgi:hypothetical protein